MSFYLSFLSSLFPRNIQTHHTPQLRCTARHAPSRAMCRRASQPCFATAATSSCRRSTATTASMPPFAATSAAFAPARTRTATHEVCAPTLATHSTHDGQGPHKHTHASMHALMHASVANTVHTGPRPPFHPLLTLKCCSDPLSTLCRLSPFPFVLLFLCPAPSNFPSRC